MSTKPESLNLPSIESVLSCEFCENPAAHHVIGHVCNGKVRQAIICSPCLERLMSFVRLDLHAHKSVTCGECKVVFHHPDEVIRRVIRL